MLLIRHWKQHRFVMGDFMMRQLYIIFIICLIGCNPQSNDKKIEQNHKDTSVIKKKPARQLDTSNIHRATLTVNKQKLIQTEIKEDQFACLTSLTGDTIVKFADYYSSIEFLDIDQDGYKDIRIFTYSNTPNECDNYLFDKVSKTYKFIKNCDLDIKLIKGTRLFYSYNRAGCADMNWESHLCKIENWNEINIGLINGKGCGDKDDGIYIYKINGETENLITTLPIKTIEKYKENKWGFIEEYWTNNYWRFK